MQKVEERIWELKSRDEEIKGILSEMLSLLVVGVEEEPDAGIFELCCYSRDTILEHGTNKKFQEVVVSN